MSSQRLRPVVFIDTETTGLDESVAEIIEIAIVRFSSVSQFVETGCYESKVIMQNPLAAHPRALEVNGYTPERWKDAKEPGVVLDEIAPFLAGKPYLIGHNIGFDMKFLREMYRRADRKMPSTDYHTVDTVTLAWPAFVAGHIDGVSLEKVCNHLGISNDGAHAAMADIRRTIAAYRRLAAA